MKKVINIFFILAILYAGTKSMYGQNNNTQQIRCGHDHISDFLREKNPNYDKTFFDEVEVSKSQNSFRSGAASDNSIYTIQVVVHILFEKNDKYQNIPDSIIHAQIDALNRDFRRWNPDTVNTRSIFKNIAADTRINFELAKQDPNGNPTTGITRKWWQGVDVPIPPIGDLVIKNSLLGGRSPWSTRKYLNIWVCDLNRSTAALGGFLGGFAFPPPGLPNWPGGVEGTRNTDGVVVDYRFFGVNNHVALDDILPNPERFNKGRTTIHEVGHYLGLRHIWGDIGTLVPAIGCLSDDGIDDTPSAAYTIGSGVCNFAADTNTCTDTPTDFPDQWENYMDYSGDACQSMFSKEQSEWMRWVLLNRRKHIIIQKIRAEQEKEKIEICEGATATLNIANLRPDYKYQWSNGASVASINVQPTTSQTYSVDVSNAFDTITLDFEVIVKPKTPQNSNKAEFTFEATNDLANTFIFTPTADGDMYNYTWHFGDGNTSLEQSPTHTFSNDSLEYTVTLNLAKDSCETFYISRKVALSVVSDVEDLIKSYGIAVYPNPTNGLLTIEHAYTGPEEIQITIYNLIGDQVFNTHMHSSVKTKVIDISDLQSSIYILELSAGKQLKKTMKITVY